MYCYFLYIVYLLYYFYVIHNIKMPYSSQEAHTLNIKTSQ